MKGRIITWWTIFRIALEERLVYRGDFMLGTLMRFLPIVTQIFLWKAIFEAALPADGNLEGYSYEDMVAYYLLTMIGRAFSSMPGLASRTALQIRDGEIKKFLIQPVDLIAFQLLGRMAHKLAYYSVAILPFGLVFYLCRSFFPPFPELEVFLCFLGALMIGFLIGFFLEISLGLIGFWFLEVSSLLFVYMLMSFFLSGHMFPIDILPEPWNHLVQLSPLKYLAYFPAAIFLGKVQGPELVRDMLIGVAWVIFFIGTSRFMFAQGVKRYSGYGGVI